MRMKKIGALFLLLIIMGGGVFAQSNNTVGTMSNAGNDPSFSQRLVWNAATYAVRYTTILEQKNEVMGTFSEILRRNTEQTYIDVTVSPGEYRFLVISYNILGLVDTQSEWSYFFIRNPITLLQPRSGISLVNNPLSPSVVSWLTEVNLQNPRVIYSRDPDPAKDSRAIVQYVAHGATAMNMPPLGEGIWYWTVFGETLDGKNMSAAAPFWFTLVSQPLLSSPRYIRPSINEVISLRQLTTDRKIVFEWNEVPEANAYIFSLYGKSDKQDLLVLSSPIPETTFELTDLSVLNMDNYIWQVEAVLVSRNGSIERRGVLQQQSFEVYIQHSNTLHLRNPGTTYGQ